MENNISVSAAAYTYLSVCIKIKNSRRWWQKIFRSLQHSNFDNVFLPFDKWALKMCRIVHIYGSVTVMYEWKSKEVAFCFCLTIAHTILIFCSLLIVEIR